MRYSSHITFNSLSQFHRFYPMTKSADEPVSCGLRVNPEYSEVEVELYNPCAPGTVSELQPTCCRRYCLKDWKAFTAIVTANRHRMSWNVPCNILSAFLTLVPSAEVAESGGRSPHDPCRLRCQSPDSFAERTESTLSASANHT